MRWMRRAAFSIFFAAALGLPGAASAITLAPPGKAGAQQYFETIPTSGGNVAPPQTGGRTGTGALPGRGRAGAASLAHLGTDGAAAAALATATAPPSASMSTSTPSEGRGTGGAAREQGLPEASAGSSTSGLTHVLTGSDTGGLGLLLPLLLATSLIAAIGLAAARLRRGGGPPQLGA